MHVAELARIDIKDADISAHAGCDLASGGAGHAGAENHHLGGPDARGAAEKNTAPAVFRL